MNNHRKVALLFKSKNANFKFISVIFQGAGREYIYKTIEDVDTGDRVVVPTVNGTQIAVVRRVLAISQVNFDVDFDYRWIISKLDKTKLKELEAIELELLAAVVAQEESQEAKAVADSLLTDEVILNASTKISRL